MARELGNSICVPLACCRAGVRRDPRSQRGDSGDRLMVLISKPSVARPSDPKHGEFVHLGYKTQTDRDSDGHLLGGKLETRGETWCNHCKKWIETNGVLGRLKFMAEHDGDCLVEEFLNGNV
jgi:hypothetical protein